MPNHTASSGRIGAAEHGVAQGTDRRVGQRLAIRPVGDTGWYAEENVADERGNFAAVGGDEGQQSDIERAKTMWAEYKTRKAEAAQSRATGE